MSPRRLLLAPALVVLTAACSDDTVHVFGAHRWNADSDCLEGAAAVDVIDGPDDGPCDAVRCWVSPGGDVYVTTTACGAPPGYVDHSADPEGSPCEAALAAYQTKTFCK